MIVTTLKIISMKMKDVMHELIKFDSTKKIWGEKYEK